MPSNEAMPKVKRKNHLASGNHLAPFPLTEEVIQSPCINVCELGADDICSGCYRSLEEIACWSYATNEERRNIVAQAMQRNSAVAND